MPNTNVTQLSHVNLIRYPEYHGDGTVGQLPFNVSIVTAVRGAWSPDGSQYIALDQYGYPTDTGAHAQCNKFALNYPRGELNGVTAVKGKTVLQ